MGFSISIYLTSQNKHNSSPKQIHCIENICTFLNNSQFCLQCFCYRKGQLWHTNLKTQQLQAPVYLLNAWLLKRGKHAFSEFATNYRRRNSEGLCIYNRQWTIWCFLLVIYIQLVSDRVCKLGSTISRGEYSIYKRDSQL